MGFIESGIRRRFTRPLLLAVLALALAAARPADTLDPKTERFPNSLSGKLLVAAPSMRDPRFKESVVLMIDHNANGAFGLIVNKPMGKLTLAELFKKFGVESTEPDRVITVFYGGPVDPKIGFVVHSSDFKSPKTLTVIPGISVSPEPPVFAAIAEREGPAKTLFVVGYAGWATGQLEHEMRRRDWVTAPATPALLFDMDDAGKWRRAFESRYRNL